MGEKCVPDELRTLFLFEALTDVQLRTLCESGHISTFETGPIHTEGDPATCFYVLLDGELVMSKRSGGVDIETNRTSQRGVYCGAWSAYIPGEEHVYQASVRVTRLLSYSQVQLPSLSRCTSVSPVAVTTSTRLSIALRHQTRIVVRSLNRSARLVSWSVTGRARPPADSA